MQPGPRNCPNCGATDFAHADLQAGFWLRCRPCDSYSQPELKNDVPKHGRFKQSQADHATTIDVREPQRSGYLFFAGVPMQILLFGFALLGFMTIDRRVDLLLVGSALIVLSGMLLFALLRRTLNYHCIRIAADGAVTITAKPMWDRRFPLVCPSGTRFTCRGGSSRHRSRATMTFYAHLASGPRVLSPIEASGHDEAAWLLSKLPSSS